jgi:hypothetical protein
MITFAVCVFSIVVLPVAVGYARGRNDTLPPAYLR